MVGNLKPIKVKKVDGDQEVGEPVSPMARMFHEPDSNVYIITMIGFKTVIEPEVFKTNLAHTLLKHPRFSSLKVVDETFEGGLKWVPTEVEIDSHVIVPNLDKNNIESPDMFVEDYVSYLSKTTIKKSVPMWDLHLLNLETSNAKTVAVLRVHHSLGDGTSLMSLFLASTRKVSDPEEPPTIIPVTKKASSGTTSGVFWQYLIKFWLFIIFFRNTLVDVLMFLATAFMLLKDTKTPLKKRHQGNGPTPRRFVHRIVSFDDVKLVKNAMKITINDVVLGVTQAGLSRYLNRKYTETKTDKGAAENHNNLPQKIRLRATLFVNLRPSAGLQKLDDMTRNGSRARWGNQIGYMLFPFTIALRENPLDYVREAKAVMDRKKASLGAFYTHFMANFLLKFCGIKMASFPSETTLWFSNVPGPREEVSYCGHPVAYIAPTCYGQPNGLMINVVSYGNKMSIILSVDESTIPDPHELCDNLEESLKLIKNEVIAEGLAS